MTFTIMKISCLFLLVLCSLDAVTARTNCRNPRGFSIFRCWLRELEKLSRGPETLVFPGTKWCGRGDIAKHDNDLGRLKSIDRCCRDHDKCSVVIKPHTTTYGFRNNSPQTLVSCDCDRKFQKCLKRVRKWYSYLTGHFVFNVIGFRCIVTEVSQKSRRVVDVGQLPFRLSKCDRRKLSLINKGLYKLACELLKGLNLRCQ